MLLACVGRPAFLADVCSCRSPAVFSLSDCFPSAASLSNTTAASLVTAAILPKYLCNCRERPFVMVLLLHCSKRECVQALSPLPLQGVCTIRIISFASSHTIHLPVYQECSALLLLKCATCTITDTILSLSQNHRISFVKELGMQCLSRVAMHVM